MSSAETTRFLDLKKRQAELQDELCEVTSQLVNHFSDEQGERVVGQIVQLLNTLTDVDDASDPVTIHIHKRLSRWLRSRTEEFGEDTETYLNGLILEDFLQHGLDEALAEPAN